MAGACISNAQVYHMINDMGRKRALLPRRSKSDWMRPFRLANSDPWRLSLAYGLMAMKRSQTYARIRFVKPKRCTKIL